MDQLDCGVPREWLNTTYWVVFDPKVPANYKGGVCRSDDGGRTWTKSNRGMDETAATHILLDPTSPVDARVLYVAGFGRGVYKSNDGGRSWTLKNQGVTQKEPFAWRLAR